jgi:hypothetical protein
LINTENLSALENARVGVEGNQWVRNLPLSEPFQVATGGVPLTLLSIISMELEKFKQWKIKPVFVWNGLNIPRKDRPLPTNADVRVNKRNKAWETYFSGDIAKASELFQSEKNIASNFVGNIIKYFYEKKVESFRAPYNSWAQLYYFLVGTKPYPTSYVHAVYGGTELLLFGAPTVILDINFEQKTFTWVDLNQILDSLKLTHEQFVDAALLAGLPVFELSTFPPIDDRDFSFQAAYELIVTFKSGYAAIQNTTSPRLNKASYLEDFLRAKVRITNHPIFDTHATCVPLNKEVCPRDLHEVMGFRLPDEVYWLISQNVISSQVVNNLISGILLETPPLLDSEDYRKALTNLLPIRTKSLALLSSCLAREFQIKRVVTMRWYDETEIEMDHFRAAFDLRTCQTSILTEDEIKIEYPRQNKSLTEWVDIGFVLQLQVHKFHAKTSPMPTVNDEQRPKMRIISTVNELLATISLHALEIREYLERKSYRPTLWGRALALVNVKFIHEAWCVLELLRLGHLHGMPLKTFLENKLEPVDKEREINLLTRIFSLLPGTMEEGRSWEGPIDPDLMGFNSIVKALYKTLRNLLEMLLANLFLSGRTALNPEDYLEVSYRDDN